MAVYVSRSGAAGPSLAATLFFALIVPCAVMLFAVHETRKGSWGHIDASAPSERRSLNAFAFSILGLSTIGAVLASLEPLALALAGCWAVVTACIAASRWLKISQHVAFAAFASVLLAPLGSVFVVAGLFGTATIAWSRLILARHVALEVAAGAVLGVLIGAALLQF